MKVVIYGAGPYGRIFLSEVLTYNAFDCVAFTVDRAYLESNMIDGLPVVAFEDVETIYPPSSYRMIVICGYTRMRNRLEMYNKAKAKGYEFINYISPKAHIEGKLDMGDNNVIYSGCIIGHDGKMGSGNIIRQNCYIGHNFCIGNHNIISVGGIIGGYLEMGDLNFLGFRVTSSGFRRIGDENLIGMGSVLTKNVESFSKVFGNPAKVHGTHENTGVLIDEYALLQERNLLNE